MAFYEHPRFTIDLATPADNDLACALFRDVHVRGELDVNQERDPDFFALQRMHQGTAYTFVIRDQDGEAGGIATAIVRPGWLDGERVNTGYLCDLRMKSGFRGGHALGAAYREALIMLRRDHDAHVFNTVVFDDNAPAVQVLTGTSAKRRKRPVYRQMTPFEMVSVQFTRKRRGPRGDVSEATHSDLPELQGFLDAQSRRRVLGEDFTDGLLERRLATWPDFSLSDFLLARRRGRIVGCLAPWDTSPVKRTRVLGYYGKMRWVRTAFDLGARLLRYPPLPPPGDCFRFKYLTHLEVLDDDPAILADLLRAAYARLLPEDLHFMAGLLPRGSRLTPAWRGFMTQRTAMTLYAVHLEDSPLADRTFTTQRPGFEMSLN